jgi:hypothetical protein
VKNAFYKPIFASRDPVGHPQQSVTVPSGFLDNIDNGPKWVFELYFPTRTMFLVANLYYQYEIILLYYNMPKKTQQRTMNF